MAVMIGHATPGAGSVAPNDAPEAATPDNVDDATRASPTATESGGRDGPDPTRFGDWEKNGRCIDF